MKSTALAVTVGGSHEPIVAAIESVTPDFVLFICSNDDPVTGNKGSYTQIQASGKIIKAKFADDKPTLENIPTQTGLSEDKFQVILVDSDDIDQAYASITAELKTLTNEYDTVICDYTGGTKSMTSSLVLAAVDNEQVQIQVVAGARGNLRKIENDLQSVQAMNVGKTRFSNAFDHAIEYWQHYNYATALQQLEALKTHNKEDQAQLQLATFACKAFVAWDVFDHNSANTMLTTISKKLGKEHKVYLQQLGVLCSDSKVTMPSRILDLWRNAQRCAARGRYDDATSRVYRLLEWSSQWLLEHHQQISTDDIPEDKIPEGVNIPRNTRNGKYMAALVPGWELAAATCGDDVEAYWGANKQKLLDMLEIRNHSILAHGYTPITDANWKKMSDFTEKSLLDFMLAQFKAVGIKAMPTQLPQTWQ